MLSFIISKGLVSFLCEFIDSLKSSINFFVRDTKKSKELFSIFSLISLFILAISIEKEFIY